MTYTAPDGVDKELQTSSRYIWSNLPVDEKKSEAKIRFEITKHWHEKIISMYWANEYTSRLYNFPISQVEWGKIQT